jgi:hypothetical protein
MGNEDLKVILMDLLALSQTTARALIVSDSGGDMSRQLQIIKEALKGSDSTFSRIEAAFK